MMVVGVEEVRKCPGAVAFAPVGAEVGPLLLEGAVKSLHFAVGLRPIGPAVTVLDVSEGLVEELAAVTETVVGEHPLDDDALRFEPGLGSCPEGGGGRSLLVGQDLGVGQSAVVVEGGVKEGVPAPPLLDLAPAV